MAVRDWCGGVRNGISRLLPNRETTVNFRKRASWVTQRIVAGALPEIGKIIAGAVTVKLAAAALKLLEMIFG